MKSNRSKFLGETEPIQIKERELEQKYLLPKLKSYSQNDCKTYAGISHKQSVNSNYLKTSEHDVKGSNPPSNRAQLSKVSFRKYQYVNKSPNYFRRQYKSIQSVKIYDHSYPQPIENYIEQKKKDFDKKSLINLVNNKIKSVSDSNKNLLTIKQPPSFRNTGRNFQEKLTKSKLNFDKVKAHIQEQKSTHSRIYGLTNNDAYVHNKKSSPQIKLNYSRMISYQDEPLMIIQQGQPQEENKYNKNFIKQNTQTFSRTQLKVSKNKSKKLRNIHIRTLTSTGFNEQLVRNLFGQFNFLRHS